MGDQAGMQLIREIKRLGGRGETDYQMLRESPSVDPIRILEHWNPNVNVKDEGMMTALHWVLIGDITNRKKIVELLLAKGADVNAKADDGATPLYLAITSSRIDIIKLLLEKGADVNAKTDDGGQTPLHRAVMHSTLDIIKLLIEKGADVNVKDQNGHTPLHLATEVSKVATVEYLLAKDADVNATDKNGQTPFHLAARYASLNTLKLLMTKNPDVNVKDRNGQTPLDIAIEDSKVATAEYLFSIPGIVMSPTDSKGRGVIERARPAMRRVIQKAQYKSFDEATNQMFPTEILNKMKRYGGKKTRMRKIKRRKTIRLG